MTAACFTASAVLGFFALGLLVGGAPALALIVGGASLCLLAVAS